MFIYLFIFIMCAVAVQRLGGVEGWMRKDNVKMVKCKPGIVFIAL